MTRLVGAGHSDVGRVRTINQDAALSDARVSVYAVADGMGGHRGGEVASALALESLVAQLAEVVGHTVGSAGRVDSVDTLVDAVLGANEAVFDEARSNAELHGMGTTLCVVALIGPPAAEQVAVANVGDSRVYVLHEGELLQLTEDHSLVQGLVRQGQLSADEAAVHPLRNVVTRVIGVEPDVEVDWWERPAIIGERYLLCSDGLFNEVSDARIAATLRQLADPAEAARTLVALANDGGGRDNVTCVVVDVLGDDVPPALDPGPTAAMTLAGELAPPIPPPEPRPRRFTFRVLAFVIVLVALVGAAAVAIRLWARHSYFVAADGQTVAIYRGRPDGVLWFDPEVVMRTDIELSSLTEAQADQVPHNTSSLDEAKRWVTRLTAPSTTRPPATTTTASTTTTLVTAPTVSALVTTTPAGPPAPSTVVPATPATPPTPAVVAQSAPAAAETPAAEAPAVPEAPAAAAPADGSAAPTPAAAPAVAEAPADGSATSAAPAA